MESLALDIAGWAAILHFGAKSDAGSETTERLGAAGDASAVPTRLRRRLPAFAREMACCALPLMNTSPHCDVIHTSSDGDLASTVALLSDTARKEILSPTQFSHSVHNAPAGVLSLCLEQPGDHTAIAAGAESLQAGLTEAYARLATSDAAQIFVAHGDERLPTTYGALDDDAPGVFITLLLQRAAAPRDGAVVVEPGRSGAAALARALQMAASGSDLQILFSPSCVQARAA